MSDTKSFPALLLGASLTLLGVGTLHASPEQTPLGFVAANRLQLLAALFGLLLTFLATLPQASERIVPVGSARMSAPRSPLIRRLRWGAGVLLIVGASAGYAWVLCRIETIPFLSRVLHTPQNPGGLAPVGVFFGALLATVLGGVLLENRRRSWLSDLGIVRSPKGTRLWRRDSFWLTLVLLGWCALACNRLDDRPAYFHGDESMIVDYGRRTWFHPERGRNTVPWDSEFQPYISCIPRGLAKELLPGRPYFGPRFLGVVVGALGLALMFLLARRHLGRTAAWFTLLLGATSHVYFAFSRMALNNMDAVVLLQLWTMATLGSWRSRRLSLGILSGVLAGTSIHAYQGAMLVFPLAGVLGGLLGLRDPKRLVRRWAVMGAMAIGVALAVGPSLWRIHGDLNRLSWRVDSVSLLNRKNLVLTFDQTGLDTLPQVLAHAVWPGVVGALLWPDTSSNYGYRGLPMVNRLALALFLVGSVSAAALSRRRALFPVLLIWGLLTIVIGSLLTMNHPYAPRILVGAPVVCILGGWAAASLVLQAGRAAGRRLATFLGSALFVLVGASGARDLQDYRSGYLNDFTNPLYRIVPVGTVDFLRHFPFLGHLYFYSDRELQLASSCFFLWETGDFSAVPIDTPVLPFPPPTPNRWVTVYVVRLLPEFAPVDAALRAAFPDAEVRDLTWGDPPLPAMHRAYIVRQRHLKSTGREAASIGGCASPPRRRHRDP